MKQVNSREVSQQAEARRLSEAEDCIYIAEDVDSTSISFGGTALWHNIKCTHPDRGDPFISGHYATCDYVWRGFCPYSGADTVPTALKKQA